MLEPLFLIDALAFGVIALIVMMASTIVLTIPVFATRGSTQMLWTLAVGFILTAEAGALIAVGILVNQEKFLQ